MPIASFPRVESPPHNPTLKELADYVSVLANITAKFSKEMQWLVNGNMDVNNLRAHSITADTLKVDELSAITVNMGKLTSGEIYGAYIATREGAYPRVELNSTNNLLGAYKDALHFLSILNLAGPDVPTLRFFDQALNKVAYLYFDPTLLGLFIFSQVDMNINSSTNINLSAANVLVNGVNFTTKADKSSFTGTLYVSNTSGGPANRAISVVNGVIQ